LKQYEKALIKAKKDLNKEREMDESIKNNIRKEFDVMALLITGIEDCGNLLWDIVRIMQAKEGTE